MGTGEKTDCQKSKSYDKKDLPLGHNAEATKKGNKKQSTTTYVNNCNYSTPDVVRMRGKTTISCDKVYIKTEL